MTDATVAINRLQALQVRRNLATKITLQHPLVLGDDLEDFVQLLLREVLRAHVRVQAGLLDQEVGARGPNAVDITEGVRDFFLRGDFNTEETWHMTLGWK